MPNEKISQIQVGSTTYDICDATARSIAITNSDLQKISIVNNNIITFPSTGTPSEQSRFRITLDSINTLDTDWKILHIDDIYINNTTSSHFVPVSWRIFADGRGFYVYIWKADGTVSNRIQQGELQINLTLIKSTSNLILPPANTDTSRYFTLSTVEN